MAINRASVRSANKFEELFDNGDIVKYKGATHDIELRMIRLRLFLRVFRCAPRELLHLIASTHSCENSWLRQVLDDVKEVQAVSPQLASLPCPIEEPTPWFEFWCSYSNVWFKCINNYYNSKLGVGYPEPVASSDVTTKIKCPLCEYLGTQEQVRTHIYIYP